MKTRIIFILILAAATAMQGWSQDNGLDTSVNTQEVDLAFSFYKNKQYDLAQELFDQITGSESGKFTELDKAWAMLGKALVDYDLSEFTTALDYLSDLEGKMDKFSDEKLSFYVYRYQSYCQLGLGNNTEAEMLARRALEFASKEQYPFVQNELVRILFFRNQQGEAVKLARANLELFKDLGDSFGLCIGYTTLGQALYQTNSIVEAVEAWQKCFEIAVSDKQYEAVVWISSSLSKHYRAVDEQETAYRYLQYNTLYKDSVQVKNSRIQLEVEAAKSQTIIRQQELVSANVENEKAQISLRRTRLIIYLFIILLILSILVFVIYRYRSKVKEQNLYFELNRARLNPHFIFNSLNSLQKSIIDGDFETSNRYLTRFARLMRETLDQSVESFIPISREIGFIKDYLELENLRFKNKFDFQIDIPDSIDQESTSIPSMLIQPIVENSIWHGLLPLECTGYINISFTWAREERFIICNIEDNGVGRDKAKRIRQDNSGPYVSKATQILMNRVNIMKRLFHPSCELSYHDKLDENGEAAGTIVRLVLPVKID